jgi:hypothetical protein
MAKGRGGTYPYFICSGRAEKRTTCKQRALRIEKVEAAVAAHYLSVQLPDDELVAVRAFLEEELSKLRLDGERERAAQQRRLSVLAGEQKKLLDAHYADAVPLDLLKSEQTRLAGEVAHAEARLAEIEGDFQKAESNLERALVRAGDCAAAYQEAAGSLRRQFNLAFFKRLLIDDDYNVSGELAEPFDALLGDDLRRAAAARAGRELQEAVDAAIRQREADGESAATGRHRQGSGTARLERENPGALRVQGFSPAGLVDQPGRNANRGFGPACLMRSSGLEPPRAVKPTRPSTRSAYRCSGSDRPMHPFYTAS